MAVSEHGARIAASKLGIPVETYLARIAAGQSYCSGHQAWHSRAAFSTNARRATGLNNSCRSFHSRYSRDWHRRRAMQQRAADQQRRFSGVSYAGPAFDAERHPLNPEGAAVATSADTVISVPTACAQNATAVTSGHIYQAVTVMDPVHACMVAELGLMWLIPVSVVTRDGQGRSEAVS